MIVPPAFMPNETLFEFESVNPVRLLDVVPAEISAGAFAVIVPLLSPQETFPEFEKVMPPKLPDVVPADTERVAAATVFAEIVTDWPFWLNVTLLPPARNIVPEEMSAKVPVVFPPSVTSTTFWVCTD